MQKVRFLRPLGHFLLLVALAYFLAPCANAHQDLQTKEDPGLTNRRTYKVGDREQFRLGINSEASGTLTAFILHEVTKVYPSGDADVLETVTKLDGTGALSMATPVPRTVRFTPYWLLKGDGPLDPASLSVFTTIVPEFDKLKKNQFITFERVLPSMGNSQVKATAKIVSVDGVRVGFGVEGKILNAFGSGINSTADVAGNLVWDSKENHYTRGSFHVSGVDPSGKTVSYSFNFERLEPQQAGTRN
jgi:hypothetical protein